MTGPGHILIEFVLTFSHFDLFLGLNRLQLLIS